MTMCSFRYAEGPNLFAKKLPLAPGRQAQTKMEMKMKNPGLIAGPLTQEVRICDNTAFTALLGLRSFFVVMELS